MSDAISHPIVEHSARPVWQRTGYKFFPYAAQQSDQWWVLRLNYDFPEHDLYTLFVDGRAAADITGNDQDHRPIVATVGALKPLDPQAREPVLAPELAQPVVQAVAGYVVYGSEINDPCDWCDHLAEHSPMSPLQYPDPAASPQD